MSGHLLVQNARADSLTDRICVRICEGIIRSADDDAAAAAKPMTRIPKMMKIIGAFNDVTAHIHTHTPQREYSIQVKVVFT